jgi:hypothetical protein
MQLVVLVLQISAVGELVINSQLLVNPFSTLQHMGCLPQPVFELILDP